MKKKVVNSDIRMFNEEAFRKIDKEKLELMSRMLQDMYKKENKDNYQILFNYGIEMQKKGLKFTKDETRLMFDLLKTNLSTKEKGQLDLLMNLFTNM